jgi:hypothetical protein
MVMSMRLIVSALLLTAGLGSLCGCSGKGAIPISPDTFTLRQQGGASDYSGGSIKAALYDEASAFCRGKQRVMSPLNSTSQDASIVANAFAEVQFQCLRPDDPRLSK